MAQVKLITTEVGKNNSGITIGIGSTNCLSGSVALGIDAGNREQNGEKVNLGPGSIDIRTPKNGIFIGNRGDYTEWYSVNDNVLVLKLNDIEYRFSPDIIRELADLITFDSNGNPQIAAGYVSSTSIHDNSINNDHLQYGCVSDDNIADGAVSGGKIQYGAVTEDKINDGAVTENKIQDGAVSEDKIQYGAVTTEKIASEAVATEHIAPYAVTGEKVAAETLTGDHIAYKTITSNNIGYSEITEELIADGSVTTDKLNDRSVTPAKIDDYAVTQDKIGDDAVTESKINDLAVTTDKIADGAVTYAKLAPDVTSLLSLPSSAGYNQRNASGNTAVVEGSPSVVQDAGIYKLYSEDESHEYITFRDISNRLGGVNYLSSENDCTLSAVANRLDLLLGLLKNVE